MRELSTQEIVIFIFTAALVLLLVFYMSAKYAESVFLLAYRKPAVVHFYPIKRKLPPYAGILLENEFRFYQELSEEHKEYFRHRVATFMKRYKFIGRDGLTVTDEMRVKVAATWVILTFGLRHYLTDMFTVIVLYPDVYRSVMARAYNLAEFNIPAGAVVFSWRHFNAGLDFNASNINLGLHEFAHVVHTGAMEKNFGAGGDMYADMYRKIVQYILVDENLIQIVNANYFRHYAYTNEREFMAVALEYFFETPDEFSQKLPELYDMMATMVNYRKVA
ncbi:MAG: zinc-dependent peptidase [Bacteroidia bacterium]